MLSVVTTATNPLSNNYLTFFACINSYAQIAEEIIVVSGGTNDGSFTSDYISPKTKSKLKIIENKKTTWDFKKNFSPNHLNTMINEGIKHCKTQWVLMSASDYVLQPCNKDKVYKELLYKNDGYTWYRYGRSFNYFGKEFNDTKISAVINLEKVDKELNTRSLFGISNISNVIYDLPIKPENGYYEENKDKNIKYRIHIGPILENNFARIDSINVKVYQHFFYTLDQLIDQKVNFYKNHWSRQRGEHIKSKKEILNTFGIDKGIYSLNFKKRSKKDLLAKGDTFINPIIENFYNGEIVGKLYLAKQNNFEIYKAKIINNYYRSMKYLNNFYLRAKGLKGLIDMADVREIHKISESRPLVLQDAWDTQDKFYS